MKLRSLSIFVFLFTAFGLNFGSYADFPKAIYGEDNRYEVFNYDDARFQEISKSVAGIVSKYKLHNLDEETVTYFSPTIKSKNNLCSDQRFLEQKSLAHCTTFLISPKLMATAGHCMKSQFYCDNTKVVFDFTDSSKPLSKKNIYQCKKIVQQELKETKTKLLDYSIFELDRPVTGRTPLKFRSWGRVLPYTPLVVIGHPSGLPLKIADGANVKPIHLKEFFSPFSSILARRYYFYANLDTFSGNSGSPVFNRYTKKVEGILVQGAKDYQIRNGDENWCREVTKFSNSTFVSSEKVFRITKIKGLKKLIKADYKSLKEKI